MAKTAAERQREYRAGRPFAGEDGNGERRLNTWLSTRAALALDRLAARYGATKREMLERLLLAEDEKLLSEMEEGSTDFENYLARKKVTA
jgi:hypothetical protein